MQYKAKTTNKTFNDVVAEAIQETFNQIFQEEGKSVINEFLKKNAKLELAQVADKPELFSKNLHKLTCSAVQIIEQTILRKLSLKLGMKIENKTGQSFPEHIKELKKMVNV